MRSRRIVAEIQFLVDKGHFDLLSTEVVKKCVFADDLEVPHGNSGV